MLHINIFAQNLVDKKFMPSVIPLKMNSFNNKVNKCLNFIDVLETYNNWTKTTNNYKELSLNNIDEFLKNDYYSI